MATLLLKLAAPIQSWGFADRFKSYETSREPTKSGVIGMCAAALGISRGDRAAIAELAKLRFGVRIDQPGEMMKDFHTAKAERDTSPNISQRYYLCDAVFVAGLECGDIALLERICGALKSPEYPLFLGRRSCPPADEVVLGLRESELLDSLRKEPWQASDWYKNRNGTCELEIIADSEDGVPLRVRDVPQSFSFSRREYGFRTVQRERFAVRNGGEHDAFGELGGEE